VPIAEAIVTGKVQARAFLGNYWLFQVATDLGNLQVTLPNIGLPDVQEGDSVGLTWSAQHACVLRRGAGTAA